MQDICDQLRYDHDFYRLSYPDLTNFGADAGRRHFSLKGHEKGRFCSAYHVLHHRFPQVAEAFDWRGLKFDQDGDAQKTPLELTLLLQKSLICGLPSKLDTNYYDHKRAPLIAKHGKIFPYLAKNFNAPEFRVLEIGSRAVCSDSTWKRHIPNCTYVGFDVMEGQNVDVVGDAHKLSSYFEKESFDAVVSFAVFEHLAMPWVVAEEIATILKVGGTLAVETHFSFSEHELPWHFFQFNANGLELLFNKDLGFATIDKGMDNPLVARFSSGANKYLQGRIVSNLFCHSSLISKKIFHRGVEGNFDWRAALPGALRETMYPSNTGLFTSAPAK